MDPVSATNLRAILLDQIKFEQMARRFNELSVQDHSRRACNPAFGEWLKVGLDLLLRENLGLVFRLTESPIERIFVNSLILNFIKNDPLNLIVQHSVKDAPSQVEAFRQRRAKFKDFISWYIAKNGNLSGIEKYLEAQLAHGRMDCGEYRYLWRHLVFYEFLCLEDSFHMVLQPGMPNIKVDGRPIRPDLLFWVPTDESIKIVVECDGFAFHQGKVAFIRDRKRDRALKVEGYDVLRYSGTEIHNDPIAISADLSEYLWSIDPSADA